MGNHVCALNLCMIKKGGTRSERLNLQDQDLHKDINLGNVQTMDENPQTCKTPEASSHDESEAALGCHTSFL